VFYNNGTTESSFPMVQQPSIPQDLPTDFDHHVVLFPTRSTDRVRGDLAALSAGRPTIRPRVRVRSRVIREIAVLEVACRLGDVVEELDRAIQLALAEGPRGVICDLSDMLEAGPDAVKVLASAGRHIRDWPGIPIAVACPDPRVREALRADPLGDHLIATTSLFSAVSAVLATPVQAVQWLRLAPHPTAPRAAREFVTRTLLNLQLGPVIPFASLVVSELVASSTVNAGTRIEVSVVWNRDAVRLTVRDHGPGLPGQRPSTIVLHGRRLTVVAGLSRTFGVLPTEDGGKVVWAVLEATQPPLSASPHDSAIARQEALILNEARSMAKVPANAGSSPNR
jgi:hypothetical protein